MCCFRWRRRARCGAGASRGAASLPAPSRWSPTRRRAGRAGRAGLPRAGPPATNTARHVLPARRGTRPCLLRPFLATARHMLFMPVSLLTVPARRPARPPVCPSRSSTATPPAACSRRSCARWHPWNGPGRRPCCWRCPQVWPGGAGEASSPAPCLACVPAGQFICIFWPAGAQPRQGAGEHIRSDEGTTVPYWRALLHDSLLGSGPSRWGVAGRCLQQAAPRGPPAEGAGQAPRGAGEGGSVRSGRHGNGHRGALGHGRQVRCSLPSSPPAAALLACSCLETGHHCYRCICQY